MRFYEVFIEVDDSWEKLGSYCGESPEDAMKKARNDMGMIGKYYPPHYAWSVNLDYIEKT